MKKNFSKKTVITMATVLCAATFVGGVMTSVNASAATEVQTLTGFECAGASVNAQELGMRFVFDLTGDAVAKKDLTAGVVYMPYDMYKGDINAFVKGQEKSLTTEFSWQDNTATADETDMVGYTYLSADIIPNTMYNRVLLVRGYIEDGENVYYTEPVKTSMAYSAWKGIAVLPDYEEQLKTYMGPYTLTYEGGKVESLYYGDTITGLPTQIDGANVEKWYWDEELTDDIAANDYATGSMNIYYELEKFTVSGTISCADDVDMTKVKISVDGVETDIAVAANGEYSLEVSAGTHNLKFYCDGYVAYAVNTEVSADTGVSVTLTSDLYEIGNYKNTNSTAVGDNLSYDAYDTDGSLTVSGKQYGVLFPNTATAENFVYITQFTAPNQKNSNADANNNKTEYGIAISNGEQVMSITFRLWGGIVVNVADTTVGNAHQRGFYATTDGTNVLSANEGPLKVEFVRTADRISVVRRGGLKDYILFHITANGIETTNLTSVSSNVVADTLSNEQLAPFFGEDKELAVGVASLGSASLETSYVCNFSTSPYIVASYGNVLTAKYKDSTTEGRFAEADGEDGNNTLTVSGTNYTVLFPNTATTDNFTFTASVTQMTSEGSTWRAPGIAVCEGSNVLSFSFLKTGAMLVCLADKGSQVIGYDYTNYSAGYKKDNTTWDTGTEFKLVRTAEKIEVYAAGVLALTVTSTGITCSNGFYQHSSFQEDKLDKTKLVGFFGENAELACGISAVAGSGGWIQNGVYTCSYKKDN